MNSEKVNKISDGGRIFCEAVLYLSYNIASSDLPAGPTVKANARKQRLDFLISIPSMVSKR